MPTEAVEALRRFGNIVVTSSSHEEVTAAINAALSNSALINAHETIRFYSLPRRLARLSPAFQSAVNRNAIAAHTISALERMHRDYCDALGSHLSLQDFERRFAAYVDMRFDARSAVLSGAIQPRPGVRPAASVVTEPMMLSEEGPAAAVPLPTTRSASSNGRGSTTATATSRSRRGGAPTEPINAAMRNADNQWVDRMQRALSAAINGARQRVIRPTFPRRQDYAQMRAQATAIVADVLQRLLDEVPPRTMDLRLAQQAQESIRVDWVGCAALGDEEAREPTLARAAWHVLRCLGERLDYWRAPTQTSVHMELAGVTHSRMTRILERTRLRHGVLQAANELRQSNRLQEFARCFQVNRGNESNHRKLKSKETQNKKKLM